MSPERSEKANNLFLYSPGRWYASYAIKHTLVYLLQNYDLVRMSDRAWHGAPLSFIWTTAIVPSPDLGVEIRARER